MTLFFGIPNSPDKSINFVTSYHYEKANSLAS